jgi:flagellar basal-body rod protein FlgB
MPASNMTPRSRATGKYFRPNDRASSFNNSQDTYHQLDAQQALFNGTHSACNRGMTDGIFSDPNYLAARKMLDYTSLRSEALASNLANVEVAGYKRVDVSDDFQTQLSKALENNSVNDIESLKPKIVKDNHEVSTRADGNNVEMDKELMEMNRNSLEYEYSVKCINYNYDMVKSAIGSSSS